MVLNIEQMVWEYRALRASVLHLWSATVGVALAADLVDVMRFNEAIDQALADIQGKLILSNPENWRMLGQNDENGLAGEHLARSRCSGARSSIAVSTAASGPDLRSSAGVPPPARAEALRQRK